MLSNSSSNGYNSHAGMSSQFSSESRRGYGNPLTDLIETEQSYIETLKTIDSVSNKNNLYITRESYFLTFQA